MHQQPIGPPSAEELHIYSLGGCDPLRAAEIEAFLESGSDCSSVLDAAPDDTVMRILRGAGPLSTAAEVSARDSAQALIDHPRYRLIRLLGQGGMGTVYLAEHRLMRRPVALKLIRSERLANPLSVERFHQEVQAAASLSNPHIVSVHDAEEFAGTHFLVMEYVEGTSLAQWLAERGPLPVGEACDCVRQAALGLQCAFERGMVHRDVKPHNLMRTPDGTIKVLDFGLARMMLEQTAAPGTAHLGGHRPGHGRLHRTGTGSG